MILPYGKYKGQEIKDVPASYLNWLVGNIKEKSKIHWTLTDKLIIKFFENKSF